MGRQPAHALIGGIEPEYCSEPQRHAQLAESPDQSPDENGRAVLQRVDRGWVFRSCLACGDHTPAVCRGQRTADTIGGFVGGRAIPSGALLGTGDGIGGFMV
jgi:hypothetical protein